VSDVDILVIGAGMAGASLAATLAPHARVLVLEAEDLPGRHTTGRSAAFFAETYGGPEVQPLTSASRAFLQAPPPWTGRASFLRPRGALHVATPEAASAVDAMLGAFPARLGLRALDSTGIRQRAPALRAPWCTRGVWEPACSDIDVAALHDAYLRALVRAGGSLRTRAAVRAIRRTERGWQVDAGGDSFTAPVLVNAAGAWGDTVAALAGVTPVGLTALRRTIITFTPPPGLDDPDAPLVIDIAGSFYFKPDAGSIWASPHDETPSPPCDARPEELDIALAAHRIEQATHFTIARINHAWAGLRTFAPDRAPVFGFAHDAPGFFWCAGQGGFGIQTAPAAARLCADIILQRPLCETLTAEGISARRYAPGRFSGR